jgi:predicted nucleotidyltransferase component of viral defense system
LLRGSSLPDIRDTEGLMVWIINLLADKFGSNAILKGGMQLRLVDCPRFTNDLDYVFVPFASKKEIKDRILKTLGEPPGLNVSYTTNSKCIRYLVAYENIKVQVEVNVAIECDSEEMSTSMLAKSKNQQGRIIRVMNFNTALAHKLAAWNERDLIRDLYDAYYLFVVLHAKPDLLVLKQRLARVESRKKNIKPTAMSIDSFIAKLEFTANNLTAEMVKNELKDYMQLEELAGLDKKIIGGISKIVDFLRV